MSMFTLAMSCLTTSNFPWFMVPMQYCSLQHRTLLPSPVTSTAGYCFCFGSISSFFLELFLHWSPVVYWAPTWGVYLSVSYLFAFSYCSWGSQGKNTEVVCHSLLHWATFCQSSPPSIIFLFLLLVILVFAIYIYNYFQITVYYFMGTTSICNNLMFLIPPPP